LAYDNVNIPLIALLFSGYGGQSAKATVRGLMRGRNSTLARPPADDTDRKLRVLVVDDHEVVHWGFKSLLGRRSWVGRYSAAATMADALEVAQRERPHVALVASSVGSDSCADVTRRLRTASPETRVLVIADDGRVSPRAARSAGAYGFVPKQWPARDIANAARLVGLGMTVFAPDAEGRHALLSTREREVLDMVAAGKTNREIAERLVLSPHTIKDHTSTLYRKIGARNRAQAIQRAQQLGLLG
jgi:DNA-binding NarL/FixJ family response regulator